ncbi:MAG: ABC transporter permease [Acidimicrobiales bacterium]
MPTLSPTLRTSLTLIANFAERESKARYKRSILGWLWSLINPLTTVAIYSLVFGVIYRAAPPVTDNGKAETFALYLFSGLVAWNLFLGVLNGAMDWLAGVSDLRKKIYFPTETAILGGAVSTLIQSGLEALVLVGIMVVLGNVSWTFVFLPVALLLIAAFGLGIGFIVSILNARYRDVRYLVGIATSVMFFLVPIVFTIDIVPEDSSDTFGLPVRTFIEINPLNQFVQIARDAVYFLDVPSLGNVLAAVAWATVSLVPGWVYFRKRSMEISEEP